MILTVFIVLMALSLVLLLAGKYIDAPPVQIASYVILFLLGVALMLGGVTYKSGESKQYSYVCGCCENGTFSTTTTDFICFGYAYTCDHWDLDELNCISAGCSYDVNSTFCSGTPTACENITSSRQCLLSGCYSESSTSYCENETIVVNNETVTDVYSNYSGEVVVGIMLHHVFGLLMALLSALGFVIVFMNLKGGLKEL